MGGVLTGVSYSGIVCLEGGFVVLVRGIGGGCYFYSGDLLCRGVFEWVIIGSVMLMLLLLR